MHQLQVHTANPKSQSEAAEVDFYNIQVSQRAKDMWSGFQTQPYVLKDFGINKKAWAPYERDLEVYHVWEKILAEGNTK